MNDAASFPASPSSSPTTNNAMRDSTATDIADTSDDSATAEPVSNDPWQSWHRFTAARLALDRSGPGLPTREWLAFSVAHAQARDAVTAALDLHALKRALEVIGLSCIDVQSAAADRATYLLRPDLGRRLSVESVATLQASIAAGEQGADGFDLVLVIGDGLSSIAVATHASGLLREIVTQTPVGWRIGPIVLASQARVALGDEVGALMRARLVATIIGERPGLGSPDSLGIYLTWQPRVGRSDAERNCIANVRPAGLPLAQAARHFWWLCRQAHDLQLTGVALKDDRYTGAFLSAETDALSGE